MDLVRVGSFLGELDVPLGGFALTRRESITGVSSSTDPRCLTPNQIRVLLLVSSRRCCITCADSPFLAVVSALLRRFSVLRLKLVNVP